MKVTCKDCRCEGVTTARLTPHPGPRCETHHRGVVKLRKQRAHARHVQEHYGITAAEYAVLYEAQGGRCFVCRRAKGRRKRLAVDHDHDLECDHPPEMGCRECVRCLACTTCNRIILGRYSPDALRRAIQVFEDPPARKVLRKV